MRHAQAASIVGLLVLVLAPRAFAASYVVDDFTAPSTTVTYTATGLGTVVSTVVPGSLPTNLNVVSDVNPQNALTTTSYGGGSLTLTSPSQGRAYAQVGYGAYASAAMSIDTTPYNYFELSFVGANNVLNINAELYSASPTGPLIYYISNGVNVLPPTGGGPFNVFIAIPSTPGFNRADVNGAFFEIDVASNAVGSNWAIDKFALTSAAPEPATWAMMLIGMGVLGAALRLARPGHAMALAA